SHYFTLSLHDALPIFLYFLRHSQRTSPKSPMGIFYRMMLRRYQIKYGFQISAKTEIGGGLYLGHWGTVVVNPQAKIGKNCNLAQDRKSTRLNSSHVKI